MAMKVPEQYLYHREPHQSRAAGQIPHFRNNGFPAETGCRQLMDKGGRDGSGVMKRSLFPKLFTQ